MAKEPHPAPAATGDATATGPDPSLQRRPAHDPPCRAKPRGGHGQQPETNAAGTADVQRRDLRRAGPRGVEESKHGHVTSHRKNGAEADRWHPG